MTCIKCEKYGDWLGKAYDFCCNWSDQKELAEIIAHHCEENNTLVKGCDAEWWKEQA